MYTVYTAHCVPQSVECVCWAGAAHIPVSVSVSVQFNISAQRLRLPHLLSHRAGPGPGVRAARGPRGPAGCVCVMGQRVWPQLSFSPCIKHQLGPICGSSAAAGRANGPRSSRGPAPPSLGQMRMEMR